MKDHRIKRLLPALVLMTALVIFAASPAFASAATGGSFGSGFSWKLDSAGTLTVSGKDAMPNFNSSTPWEAKQSKIKKIVVREGITGIGAYAFEYCPATSVQLPNSLTSIGKEAFSGTKLQSLVLPGSVTKLGGNCFQFCESLKTVKLSAGCRMISEYAFGGCRALTKVEIPEGTVRIGENAFGSCNQLQTVVLPESLERIDKEAFSKGNWYEVPKDLKDITSINFPARLKYIGNQAFLNAGLTEDMVVPDWVEYLGREAFDGTYLQQKILDGGQSGEHPGMVIVGTTLMNYKGTAEVVQVPEGITAISNYAFQGLEPGEAGGSWRTGMPGGLPCDQKTKKVILPESVKYIGEEAFFGAKALQEINLDHVKVIEDAAFRECAFLKKAELGSDITSCGNGAFMGCTALTAVNTGGLKAIPANMFRDDSKLAAAVYPSKIDSIGNGAFENCKKLTAFPVLSDKATRIPERCFFYCKAMTKFRIPASVTKIEDSAFKYCTSLGATFVIPPTVRSVDSEAFKKSGVKKIKGVMGSAAYSFAKKAGLSFVQMGTKSQTVKAKAAKKKVKYSKVKKKTQVVAPIRIIAARGSVVYKITGGTSKAKKALKINSKTGKVKVKKGTKKGTYSVKVKVTAYGTTESKAASKTVTVKVRVK